MKNKIHRSGNVSLCLIWTVKCLCQISNSFRWKYSFYGRKFVKYIKFFKIQAMSSPKNGLLKCIKFEFWHVSSFSCIWKKDRKIFAKNTVTFWHNIAYMVNSFVFIIYDNYDYRLQKLFIQSAARYAYCDYNDISMVYINSNIALLRVRYHWMIITTRFWIIQQDRRPIYLSIMNALVFM